MRIFRYLANLLIVLLLNCVLTVFGTLSLASYYFVNQIHHITFVDPNSDKNATAVVQIVHRYLQEVVLYEQSFRQQPVPNSPPLCQTLCGPTEFNYHQYKEKRIEYLQSFYNQAPTRALQDPLFRIRIEEMEFLKDLLTPRLRRVLSTIFQEQKNDFSTQLKLSLQLETALLAESLSLEERFHKGKRGLEKLDRLRHLARTCQRDGSVNEVTQQCLKL